jgi:hypothetical protein
MLSGLLPFLTETIAVDHQTGAFLREAVRDGSTGPAPPGTGHDRYLALQAHSGESSH